MERRVLLRAKELHEDVVFLDEIPFADVHLRDARGDSACGVYVDSLDNAAAAGRPVLGSPKVADAQHEGDEEAGR